MVIALLGAEDRVASFNVVGESFFVICLAHELLAAQGTAIGSMETRCSTTSEKRIHPVPWNGSGLEVGLVPVHREVRLVYVDVSWLERDFVGD